MYKLTLDNQLVKLVVQAIQIYVPRPQIIFIIKLSEEFV